MAAKATTILTVDDDAVTRQLIARRLAAWEYRSAEADDADAMWTALADTTPAAILLDVHLGDDNGADLVGPLRARCPDVPVIMITAYGSVSLAVASMKAGAFDFICKPIDFDHLHAVIDKAVEHHKLRVTVRDLNDERNRIAFCGMIGGSEAMQGVYRLIESVAPTTATVLILGQTGTGKELIARALHQRSRRSDGPFVAVNAAAIPHELIESTLFGHEAGAFTGAQHAHTGLCEQADGGTLLLDEICEMNVDVQAKLLRFLQDRTVQRVGGNSARPVDVRVVAATNQDPHRMIEQGLLREDLYYRLNVVVIEAPTLHDRIDDVPLLARYFLNDYAARHDRPMRDIDEQALDILKAFPWPGNVRQLEHLIEQLVVMHPVETLTSDLLPESLTGDVTADRTAAVVVPRDAALGEGLPTMEAMERSLIDRALEASDGNVAAAARHLHISEATIYRRIKQFGLKR